MINTEVPTQLKAPQVLYRTGALGPGSQLWVLAGGEATEWAKKLDWYLNFQISKAQRHQPQQLDPEFEKRINEYEIPLPQFSMPADQLMIACEGRLPTKMLVIVTFHGELQDWLESVHSLWLKLLKPNLRLFLPIDFPLNEFNYFWPDRSAVAELTLVPSQKLPQS